MASAEAQQKKTCVVCGTDVSGRPRVKDAAGRYLCKEGDCQTKAASAAAKASSAAKAAPLPAGPGTNDGVLNALLDDAQKNLGKGCPNCHSSMKKGAMICLNCGFNVQAGKSIRTRVTKEKEPGKAAVAAQKLTGAAAIFLSPWAIAGYLVAVLIGVGVAGAMIEGMALPALLVISLAYLACLIWAIIDAFMEGEIWMGWFMVSHAIGGFVPSMYIRFSAIIGFFVAIYYCLLVTERGYLRALYLGTSIGFGTFLLLLHNEGKLDRFLNPL